MTGQALLLAPSRGLGGGIERYAETLEWAFAARGVVCRRLDLQQAGMPAHVRMVAQGRRFLRAAGEPTRVVAVHRALLPVACLLARESQVSGISIVCHGGEVWGKGGLRRYVENRLMRREDVRVVTASSFTGGVLSPFSPATVLTPGLSEQWFRTLTEASAVAEPQHSGLRIVTAFRLREWRSKGLPQLLEAVASLRRSDVHVTVCGSGSAPPELLRLAAEYRHCTLRSELTDRELAHELAAADLFVLATRTRMSRMPCGEGFGLVLLEAQVAGTGVVAPAYGGSHDAFVDRVTGRAPADETTEALATLLGGLLEEPGRLAQLGKRAAEWSRECFAPDCYAARVVTRLL